VRALILSVVLLLPLAGCGDQYADVQSDNPSRIAEGLVFTRADGSSYQVDQAVAHCSTSDVSGTQYVQLEVDDDSANQPRFLLEVAAGVTGTRQLPLRDKLWAAIRKDGTGPADLLVLAHDPHDGTRLAAFGSHASGTVTVTEASCDPQPRITIQISAELDNPSGHTVHVQGGLASVT